MQCAEAMCIKMLMINECMHQRPDIFNVSECLPLCLGWLRVCARVWSAQLDQSLTLPGYSVCVSLFLLLSDYKRQTIKSRFEKVACNEALLFTCFPLCIIPIVPSLLPEI